MKLAEFQTVINKFDSSKENKELLKRSFEKLDLKSLSTS